MTTMSSHARAWRFQGSGADRGKIVERRTVSVDQTTSRFFSDGSLGGLSPASGSPQLHINMPRGTLLSSTTAFEKEGPILGHDDDFGIPAGDAGSELVAAGRRTSRDRPRWKNGDTVQSLRLCSARYGLRFGSASYNTAALHNDDYRIWSGRIATFSRRLCLPHILCVRSYGGSGQGFLDT